MCNGFHLGVHSRHNLINIPMLLYDMVHGMEDHALAQLEKQSGKQRKAPLQDQGLLIISDSCVAIAFDTSS